MTLIGNGRLLLADGSLSREAASDADGDGGRGWLVVELLLTTVDDASAAAVAGDKSRSISGSK